MLKRKKEPTNLLPLMYVSDQAAESEQSKQTEQLDQTQHFECAASPGQLIVLTGFAYQQK